MCNVMTDLRNGNFQAEKMNLQKEKYLKLKRLWKTIPLMIKKKKSLRNKFTQRNARQIYWNLGTLLKEIEDLKKMEKLDCDVLRVIV